MQRRKGATAACVLRQWLSRAATVLLVLLPLCSLEGSALLERPSGWVLTANTHAEAIVLPEDQDNGSMGEKIVKVGEARPVFVPPFLRFTAQELCKPVQHKVTIVNANPHAPLHLSAIYSNSHEFHSSWFENTLVQPGANTTFTVAYLGFSLGPVQSSLTVSTSHGDVVFDLFAESTANELRLRPLAHGLIPIKLRLAQTVTMYNPHPFPLMVEEVFSSAPEVQVEVAALFNSPDLEGAAYQHHWLIPPLATKPIFLTTVTSQEAKLVLGFIYVRTNHTASNSVIPVQVDVVSGEGLFFGPGDMIDFGALTRTEPATHRSIQVLYKAVPKSSVRINDVRVTQCSHAAHPERSCPTVDVHNRPEKFTLPSMSWTRIATVTLGSGQLTNAEGVYTGIVTIWYSPDTSTVVRTLKVPFMAQFLPGALDMPGLDTCFYLGGSPFKPQTRQVTLQNSHHFPIQLFNLTMPSDTGDLFSVDASLPATLQPEAELRFNVTFTANSTDIVFNKFMAIATNQSQHRLHIPLFTYNGQLRYAISDKARAGIDFRAGSWREGGGGAEDIDFGVTPLDRKPSTHLHVLNPNPVRVHLDSFTTDMPGITLRLDTVASSPDLLEVVDYGRIFLSHQRLPEPAVRPNPSEEGHEMKTINVTMEPGAVVSFTVTLEKPREETLNGELRIYSTYGVLYIPVSYRGTQRVMNLSPTSFVFLPTFPSQSYMPSDPLIDFQSDSRLLDVRQPQQLFITPDQHSINIEKVYTTDARVFFEQNPQVIQGLSASANSKVLLGSVVFDPSLAPEDQNYMPRVRRAFSRTGKTLQLDVQDLDEVARCDKVWRALERRGGRNISAQIVLEANSKVPHSLDIQAQLYRPRLFENRSLVFPLTQAKRTSVFLVPAFNHGRLPLLLEIVSIEQVLEGALLGKLENFLSLSSNDIKSLKQARGVFHPEDFTTSEHLQGVPQGSENLGRGTAVVLGPSRLLIPPYSNVTIPLAFSPDGTGSLFSYLLFLNNLTLMEAMHVSGVSGQGTFGFPKTQPHVVNGSLILPIRVEDLGACKLPGGMDDTHAQRSYAFNYTVVNRGNMPVTVESLGINGHDCAADGFRIHNCHPFVLEPKRQHFLIIGFTPDFTTATVKRRLTVQLANKDRADYFTLHATLPPEMLPLCFQALPWPLWASYLKPAVVVASLCLGAALLWLELHDPGSPHKVAAAGLDAQRREREHARRKVRLNGKDHRDHGGEESSSVAGQSHAGLASVAGMVAAENGSHGAPLAGDRVQAPAVSPVPSSSAASTTAAPNESPRVKRKRRPARKPAAAGAGTKGGVESNVRVGTIASTATDDAPRLGEDGLLTAGGGRVALNLLDLAARFADEPESEGEADSTSSPSRSTPEPPASDEVSKGKGLGDEPSPPDADSETSSVSSSSGWPSMKTSPSMPRAAKAALPGASPESAGQQPAPSDSVIARSDEPAGADVHSNSSRRGSGHAPGGEPGRASSGSSASAHSRKTKPAQVLKQVGAMPEVPGKDDIIAKALAAAMAPGEGAVGAPTPAAARSPARRTAPAARMVKRETASAPTLPAPVQKPALPRAAQATTAAAAAAAVAAMATAAAVTTTAAAGARSRAAGVDASGAGLPATAVRAVKPGASTEGPAPKPATGGGHAFTSPHVTKSSATAALMRGRGAHSLEEMALPPLRQRGVGPTMASAYLPEMLSPLPNVDELLPMPAVSYGVPGPVRPQWPGMGMGMGPYGEEATTGATRGDFMPTMPLIRPAAVSPGVPEENWALLRTGEPFRSDYTWHEQGFERRSSATGVFAPPAAVSTPPVGAAPWWGAQANGQRPGGYNPELTTYQEPAGFPQEPPREYYNTDMHRQRSPGGTVLFGEAPPRGSAGLLPPVTTTTSIWSTGTPYEPDLSWAADLNDEDAPLADRPRSNWPW